MFDFRKKDDVYSLVYKNLLSHVLTVSKCVIKKYIERDPVGVSLAGKHNNYLTYFSLPRYLSQLDLGVWRVVGGGCGQEGHRNGIPKKGKLMPKPYHLKSP